MRFLGFEIRRQKAAVAPVELSPTFNTGWNPLLREGKAGDWQRSTRTNRDSAVLFHAVFACVTRIAGDISKLGINLVAEDTTGVRVRVRANSPFLPVLRRPNRFQNRIEFIEQWILSLLLYGNTYVLKVRDNRNVVVALYILDPRQVRPLVAPGAAVFYALQADNLSTVEEAITVPADDIIHNRINSIHHPLIGISPIAACHLAAAQGLEIQHTSAKFFANGAWPGGFLTAPGMISDTTAERLKSGWEQNYGGENRGRTAVLGDGLKYEPLTVNPVDAQLLEQLKYSSEMVCTAFHIPPYIVGIGAAPTNNNAELMNQIYYSHCLQRLIEGVERSLGDGLALPNYYDIQFSIDDLLRMDSRTQMEVLEKGVGAGVMAPNEARSRMNLPPVEGGDSPYLQQQNFSLEALHRRDQTQPPPPSLDEENTDIDLANTDDEEPDEDEEDGNAAARSFLDGYAKAFELAQSQ